MRLPSVSTFPNSPHWERNERLNTVTILFLETLTSRSVPGKNKHLGGRHSQVEILL
jgi:hypothetical protein